MPKAYDKNRPTSAEYWLTDLGAARPKNEPLFIIAADGLSAFEFALAVATARGLDLTFVASENLDG